MITEEKIKNRLQLVKKLIDESEKCAKECLAILDNIIERGSDVTWQPC